MKIHHAELSDVVRYVDSHKSISLEDKRSDFDALTKIIKRYKPINQDTRLLEVGIGTGWFGILCKSEGIVYKGLEISPHLVEYARAFGRRCGLEPDIQLGNIEEVDLGTAQYDIVVASATFEHVERWQDGLRQVFNALKPGGLLYFYSSNKFSLRSSEFDFPLYGWLPDRWRYALRKSRQGEDIMELGIDFNQFTYFQLRRFFKRLGFSAVMDRVDVLDPDNLNHPTLHKRALLKVLQRCPPLRHAALLFTTGTLFVCIK
jgi:SAM-dependent methyltransferase